MLMLALIRWDKESGDAVDGGRYGGLEVIPWEAWGAIAISQAFSGVGKAALLRPN